MAFKFAIGFSLLLVHLSLVISEPVGLLSFPSLSYDSTNGARRPERSLSQRRQPFVTQPPKINLFRPLATITNGIANEADRVYQDEVRPAYDYYSNQVGQNVAQPLGNMMRIAGLQRLVPGGHSLATKVLGDTFDNLHGAGQLGMRTTADVMDAGADYQDQVQDQGEQMLNDTFDQVQGFNDYADEFVGTTQNQARSGLKQVGKGGKQAGKMADVGMYTRKRELEEANKRARAALGQK